MLPLLTRPCDGYERFEAIEVDARHIRPFLCTAVDDDELGSEHFVSDPPAMRPHCFDTLTVAPDQELDSIADRQPLLFSHPLYPTYELACRSLEAKLRRHRGIDRREKSAVLLHD